MAMLSSVLCDVYMHNPRYVDTTSTSKRIILTVNQTTEDVTIETVRRTRTETTLIVCLILKTTEREDTLAQEQ
jgi:hypothetical protein